MQNLSLLASQKCIFWILEWLAYPQTRLQDAPDIEETPGAVRCRSKKNGAGWLKAEGECWNRFKLST